MRKFGIAKFGIVNNSELTQLLLDMFLAVRQKFQCFSLTQLIFRKLIFRMEIEFSQLPSQNIWF